MKLLVLLRESDGGPTPGSPGLGAWRGGTGGREPQKMGQATRVGWLPARTSRGRSFCGGHWACHARSHWACHACTHAGTHTHAGRTHRYNRWAPLTHVLRSRGPGGGYTTTCPLRSSAVGVCFWFSASALCSHFMTIVPPNPPTWEPCSSQIRVRNTCACGEKRRCRDLNPEQTVGILTIRFFPPKSRRCYNVCVARRSTPSTSNVGRVLL